MSARWDREQRDRERDKSPHVGPSLLADTSLETKDLAPTNGKSILSLRQDRSTNTRIDLSSAEAAAEHRPRPISSQSSASPPPQAEQAQALHDGSPSAHESDIDKEKPGGSRFFPKPISTDLPAPQAGSCSPPECPGTAERLRRFSPSFVSRPIHTVEFVVL
ncbi:hypothetical protein EDD22DRAFT_961909 [Suillus occidentalis]|nr:hypothetical protein EDD22DRAFT_961909 [Suillus occidentalis]